MSSISPRERTPSTVVLMALNTPLRGERERYGGREGEGDSGGRVREDEARGEVERDRLRQWVCVRGREKQR